MNGQHQPPTTFVHRNESYQSPPTAPTGMESPDTVKPAMEGADWKPGLLNDPGLARRLLPFPRLKAASVVDGYCYIATQGLQQPQLATGEGIQMIVGGGKCSYQFPLMDRNRNFRERGILTVNVIFIQSHIGRVAQERVKSLFKFCLEAGLVQADPAGQLSTIQVKADEANDVRPLEPAQYKSLLAAAEKCGMTPKNAARVLACIKLQRWSGLIDAVWLAKDELVQMSEAFRVTTERRTTGAHINNVIPEWLGKNCWRSRTGIPTSFSCPASPPPRVR
jgi:hypothetical protein